jgi:hypothetical protein
MKVALAFQFSKNNRRQISDSNNIARMRHPLQPLFPIFFEEIFIFDTIKNPRLICETNYKISNPNLFVNPFEGCISLNAE